MSDSEATQVPGPRPVAKSPFQGGPGGSEALPFLSPLLIHTLPSSHLRSTAYRPLPPAWSAAAGDSPATFPGLALCGTALTRHEAARIQEKGGTYRGTLRQSELLESSCLLHFADGK